MEKFVVSARKYRPSLFKEVVGQESVTNTLKNAIRTDHLGQSFLFCGPRGVGKTTCARILAKTINCENLMPDYEACGTCTSCQSFKESSSFNIFELDAASNSSVEDIRGLIEQVRYAPQAGKYKIYIIDEVHMLSQSAFNAFLKTLEEPPSYAIFILATTEKHKIIPTILSRCQIFDFNRIYPNDVANFLQSICEKEQIEAEFDALHLIGQKADGALRDALSIFDRIVSFSGGNIKYQDVITNLNILDHDYYFKVTEACVTQDVAGVMNIFDQILRNGFEGDDFMNGLGNHMRNVLVCQDAATLKLLEVSEQLRGRYQEQAGQVPTAYLINALSIINTCDVSYKTSKNKRLHVEMALIKLCYIPAAVKLAGGEMAIDLSKKKQPLAESAPTEPSQQEEPTPSEPPVHVPSAKEPLANAAPTPEASTPTPPKDTPKTQPDPSPAEEAPSANTTSQPETVPSEPAHPEAAAGLLNTTSIKLQNLDSIKAAVKQPVPYENNEASQVSEAAEPEAEGATNEEVHILDDDLQTAWKTYTEQMASEGKMSLNALMMVITPTAENNLIQVPVENKLQMEIFDGIKVDLLGFLKAQLQQPDLLMQFFIQENPEAQHHKRAYTATDKLKKMAEKEPLIIEFKDRLNLELDP